MSSKAEAKVAEATAAPVVSTSDELPPPYIADSGTIVNPGFCELSWRERQDNRVPGGGMTADQYFAPCKACGLVCGDHIPAAYKAGWLDWVDPSVNFRWESHTGVAVINGEKKELLSCWICWEYDHTWVKPMLPDEWYLHMRKHFKVDGYRPCKGAAGAMQRRRNCSLTTCPKIHS